MLIERLTLRNLLSFGPNAEPLELRPLNILIGPNGSGKSNLLAAIDLLRNAPEQIAKPIREGGGIQDWLWKGGKRRGPARVDAIVKYFPIGTMNPSHSHLHYLIEIDEAFNRMYIVDEIVEDSLISDSAEAATVYYRLRGPHPGAGKGMMSLLMTDSSGTELSIFAQRRDAIHYPEITVLGHMLGSIKIYRDWEFGRNTAPRLVQKADMPNDILDPNCSNLALVLSHLREDPHTKARILEALKKLCDGIDDYDVRIVGGYVQAFFHERGMTIPATRLSDGTLRYLCLLAILCHPNPPPLVCIEEPELGLHPDILPTLATLLREASERCQLIVTTHSDILVDAMTDTPEAIVVCEKHEGATTMKRLSAADLKPWLERYRLGDLWTSGQLGGTRW
jgi:predicted ATPase